MTFKPMAERLTEIARNLQQTAVARELRQVEETPSRRIPVESVQARSAPETRRIPAPPPSSLVQAKIRSLNQEEARLHWHHHELPVSRFSACMLMPG